MNILDEKELIEMLANFYGKDFIDVSLKEQQIYIDRYRKVEIRNNAEIEKAGGIKNWYASGEGRVLKNV
jgi:hypothetical protein